MNRHKRSSLLGLVLAVLPLALMAALMQRNQTIIDVPEPGSDVPLSGLAYGGSAFHAVVSSVRLELKEGSDAVAGEWNFAGSNTDGQIHKIEIFVRLLDESGTQREVFSNHCTLVAAAHDQPCGVSMKVKAETWKATKRIRIGVDWRS